MIYVWVGIFFLALIVLWVVFRDTLKAKPGLATFFTAIEPIEMLWKKSSTILFARLKIIIGLLLTLLTQIGAIDLTPIMPLVPEKYKLYVTLAFNALPLIITLLGAIDEVLRRETFKPLEVVALPEAQIAVSPALKQVVENAEQVKMEAQTVVPAAKLEAVDMIEKRDA